MGYSRSFNTSSINAKGKKTNWMIYFAGVLSELYTASKEKYFLTQTLLQYYQQTSAKTIINHRIMVT